MIPHCANFYAIVSIFSVITFKKLYNYFINLKIIQNAIYCSVTDIYENDDTYCYADEKRIGTGKEMNEIWTKFNTLSHNYVLRNNKR